MYKCNVDSCGREFLKLNKYNRHVKGHSAERPFCCEVCLKSFKRNDHLRRHKQSHGDNPRPFRCDIDGCMSFGFADKYHLLRHIKTVHDNEKNCKECGISFLKKSQHDKHIALIHKSSQAHKCNDCGMDFEQEECYEKHIERHADKKQLLGKRIMWFHDDESLFSQNDTPSEKIVEIKEEAEVKKSLPCDKCDKSFISIGKLNTHKKIHENILFACAFENCFKAFSTSYNLSIHHKTQHLKERRYVCTICDARYLHNKSLKEHMQKIHSQPCALPIATLACLMQKHI